MLTRLSLFLDAREIKQTTVARQCGIQRVRLHRIVHGEARPTLTERRRIAQALGAAEEGLFEPLAAGRDAEVVANRLCVWLRTEEGVLVLSRLIHAGLGHTILSSEGCPCGCIPSEQPRPFVP